MAEGEIGEVPKTTEISNHSVEYLDFEKKGYVVDSKKHGTIVVDIVGTSDFKGGFARAKDEKCGAIIRYDPEDKKYTILSTSPFHRGEFSSGSFNEEYPFEWTISASEAEDVKIEDILIKMTDGEFKPKEGSDFERYLQEHKQEKEKKEETVNPPPETPPPEQPSIPEPPLPEQPKEETPEPIKTPPDLSPEPESGKIGIMPQEKGPTIGQPPEGLSNQESSQIPPPEGVVPAVGTEKQGSQEPTSDEKIKMADTEEVKPLPIISDSKLRQIGKEALWASNQNPTSLRRLMERGSDYAIDHPDDPEIQRQWELLGGIFDGKITELEEQEQKKAEPEAGQKPDNQSQLAEESRLDTEIRQINQEIQASKRELENLLYQISSLLGKIRSLTSPEAAQALREGETIKRNIERLVGELNSAKDEIDTLKRMSFKDKKDNFERSRLSGKDFIGEVNRYQRELTELTDREKELRGKEDEKRIGEEKLNTEIGQAEKDRVNYETELQKLSLRVTSILDAIKNKQLIDAVQLTARGERVRQQIPKILTSIGLIKTRINSLSGLSFGDKKTNLESIRIDISNIDNSIKLLTEETNLLNKDIETGKKKESINYAELPKYVGAVFAEGAYSTERLDALNIKRYSEDKSESEVRRFNVLDKTERDIWLSRKIAKLQKGIEHEMKINKDHPDSWKERVNEWIEDFTKAADKTGLNSDERDKFLYKIYAAIAVTISARAMEASGGVYFDYARIVGAHETKPQDNYSPLFLVRGDSDDKTIEVNGVLYKDSKKVAAILEKLPIGGRLSELKTWELVTYFYQKMWIDAGVRLEAGSNLFQGIDIPTAKNSKLVSSLKSRNEGLNHYIKTFLKPRGSEQEVAAKMACDIFLSTIYTQWQAAVEGELDKVDGKIPRLFPSQLWEASPFMEFCDSTSYVIGVKNGLDTIRERFKGIDIPGYINNAVIPEDLFPKLSDPDKIKLLKRIVRGNSLEEFKKQIRFDQILLALFGTSKAESLPKLDFSTLGKANEVTEGKLKEVAVLLGEVYGGDVKEKEFSRKLIAVCLTRIARLKVELNLMYGIASDKPAIRGKDNAPARDEALKFFQGSLYNGEGGFFSAVLGGIVGIDLDRLDRSDPLNRIILENVERVNDLLLTGDLDCNPGEYNRWKGSQKTKGFIEPLGKVGKGIGQIFGAIGLKVK